MSDSILLTRADIKGIVDAVGVDALMDQLIEALAKQLREFDAAEFDIPIRSGFQYASPERGLLEWMPVRADDGPVTIKLVGYHPGNPSRHGLPTILSTIACFDSRTGHLRGISDATFLTAIRTGAASAVATRVLAVPESRTLGLIGVGAQALTQLHAISRVCPLEEVLLCDPDDDVANSFADRAAALELSHLKFRRADARELIALSDVVCTATSIVPGTGPVFESGACKPWLHVNAVGSDFAGKTELPATFVKGSLVCPDFVGQALIEGECQILTKHEVGPDLVEVVQRADELKAYQQRHTVFDSTGWALEDHVAIELLLDHAHRLRLGTIVELESIPEDPHNPYSLGSVAQVPLRGQRSAGSGGKQ